MFARMAELYGVVCRRGKMCQVFIETFEFCSGKSFLEVHGHTALILWRTLSSSYLKQVLDRVGSTNNRKLRQNLTVKRRGFLQDYLRWAQNTLIFRCDWGRMSWEYVLTRVFEVIYERCEELAVVNHGGCVMFSERDFIFKLAYLSDMFGKLVTLNNWLPSSYWYYFVHW
jgi:hypothetical protein